MAVEGYCQRLNVFLSQGPHELNQLVPNKSENVPEGESGCFSQVALLISCICYNTTSVYPGTVRDIYYSRTLLSSQCYYLNHLSRKVQGTFICAAMTLAVDSVKDTRDKEPIFLYNNREKRQAAKRPKRKLSI